ncbi:ephrin type-A receptor 3-like [Halichondria panicea]|uniref:ephrin type-A receptor 3-like n=1 Tax=Halichondria panicea TaxID=6063 RepID=UPI00312BCB30
MESSSKDAETVYILACVQLLFYAVLHYVSGQCDVGATVFTETNARTNNAFYLNSARPVSCNGTINSFSYCYYRPSRRQFDVYVATFAVYRLNSRGTAYNPVSEVFQARKTQKEISEIDFACFTITLKQRVSVETGDVFGACVINPSDRNMFRLDLVGRGTDRLRRISQPSRSQCSETAVPTSVSVSGNTVTGTLYINAMVVSNDISESATTTDEVAITTNSPTMTTDEAIRTSATDTTDSMPAPNSPSSAAGPTAAAVVVVLLILAGLIATVTVIVIVWKGKQKRNRPTSSYTVSTHPRQDVALGIDNMVYAVDGGKESANNRKESEDYYEVSQEHFYELTESNKMMELSSSYYAEIGPFNEVVNENVYESPLDAKSISFVKLMEKNRLEDIYGYENPYEVPAESEDHIYEQFSSWGISTITSGDVKIAGHLGSGQFGSVEQGVWKRQGTQPVDVALKSLTKTSEEDKVKFLQEAAIMAQFRHPNIIMLHGVISEQHPIRLVVELAKRGDLRNLLRSLRPDPGQLLPGSTSSMLLKFSQQVALGMQYLSAKGFVHRDLAARNVLVTQNNMCKVADFGMSRDLNDENYYVSQARGMIPVKWTAPEALHYKKYSTASDVWAYGCLLYEIWSLGHKPFENFENLETIQLVDSGQRLSPPPGCSKIIYQLMMHCWHSESSQRPGFRDIVLMLVGSEKMVLSIPKEDSSTNPLAGVLGAPLEAGKNMYSQLQNRYSRSVLTV